MYGGSGCEWCDRCAEETGGVVTLCLNHQVVKTYDDTHRREKLISDIQEVADRVEQGLSPSGASQLLRRLAERSRNNLCGCEYDECCTLHDRHSMPHRGCMLR